jgi:hypothetical protein
VIVKALTPPDDGRSRPKHANPWSVYTRTVSTVSGNVTQLPTTDSPVQLRSRGTL